MTLYQPYKNILPLTADKLDLFDLSYYRDDKTLPIYNGLTRGSMHERYLGAQDWYKRLLHLDLDARLFAKHNGYQGLNIGFPMYICVLNSDLIAAPMLFWGVDLKPEKVVGNWTLKSVHQKHVFFNPFLLNHWTEKGMDVSFLKGSLHKLIYDYRSLQAFIQRVCHLADLPYKKPDNNISPVIRINELADQPEEGVLRWSGVLGLFSNVNDEYLLDKSSRPISWPNKKEHSANPNPLGLGLLNPHQEWAANQMRNNRINCIQSSNVVDRDRLIFNHLTNNLIHGKTSIVVGDSMFALTQILRLFNALEIPGLAHTITDKRFSGRELLELFFKMIDNLPVLRNIIDDSYESVNIGLARTTRLYQRLGNSYKATQQKIFGEFTTSDIVAKVVELKNGGQITNLSKHISLEKFEFLEKEYSVTKSMLHTTQKLYRQVGVLEHQFNDLNNSIFTDYNSDESLQKVQGFLNTFINKFDNLKTEFTVKLNFYERKLKEELDIKHKEFGLRISHLRDIIEDFDLKYPNQSRPVNYGWLSWKLLFSKKMRKFKSDHDRIEEVYQGTLRTLKKNGVEISNYTFEQNGDLLEFILLYLKDIENSILEWRNFQGLEINQNVDKLRVDRVFESEVLDKTIGELIELNSLLNQSVDEMNNKKVFANKIVHHGLTVKHSISFIEDLLLSLINKNLGIGSFLKIYPWQKNWVSLDPKHQQIVLGMVRSNASHWINSFEYWYFNNLLDAKAEIDLPRSSSMLKEYYDLIQELRNKLPLYIKSKVNQRKLISLKRIRQKIRKDYKENINVAVPLHELFTKFGKDLITVFPVLFVNVEIAQTIGKYDEMKFDDLILLESNHIEFNHINHLVHSSSQCSVFGDQLISDKNSLINVAREQVNYFHKLPNYDTFIHNKSKENYNLNLINLSGRHKEKDEINQIEASKVFQLLFELEPFKNGNYPSIGILTFSKAQKKLINELIFNYKQKNSALAEKIRDLERKGLFVLFGTEILGFHFEKLIVSFGYGVVEEHFIGFSKNSFINTTKGIKTMEYLIRNYKTPTVLLNSIPISFYDNFQPSASEYGVLLLANFIRFVADNNNRKSSISKKFVKIFKVEQNNPPKIGLFYQMLYNQLSKYIPEPHLVLTDNQYYYKPMASLTVKSNENKDFMGVIFNDIFLSKLPLTSFEWEYRHRLLLSKNKIKIFDTFSVEWFQNSDAAIRRIASQIIQDLNTIKPEVNKGIK